jgi:hypothetical protein
MFFRKQIPRKRRSIPIQHGIPFAPVGITFAKYDENSDFLVTMTFEESTLQVICVDEMSDRTRVTLDAVDFGVISTGIISECDISPEWSCMVEAAGTEANPSRCGLYCHFLLPENRMDVRKCWVFDSLQSQSYASLLLRVRSIPKTIRTYIGRFTLIIGGVRGTVVGKIGTGSSTSGKSLSFYSPILEESVFTEPSKSDLIFGGILHLHTISDHVEFIESQSLFVVLTGPVDSEEGISRFSRKPVICVHFVCLRFCSCYFYYCLIFPSQLLEFFHSHV